MNLEDVFVELCNATFFLGKACMWLNETNPKNIVLKSRKKSEINHIMIPHH